MTTSDHGFTPREQRVLELTANGLRAKAIARQLHVSPSTVHADLVSMRSKTGASTLPNLVHLGHLAGLLGEVPDA